jgi:protein-S-isoprenylcysteine O-methyltransferase Ste14
VGIILFTIGLTSWSVWLLNITFGMGFLSSSQTLAVWFIELLAYVLLAAIEERYLARAFSDFEAYQSQTLLFIPFPTTNNPYLEISLSLVIPVLILVVLLQLPA